MGGFYRKYLSQLQCYCLKNSTFVSGMKKQILILALSLMSLEDDKGYVDIDWFEYDGR